MAFSFHLTNSCCKAALTPVMKFSLSNNAGDFISVYLAHSSRCVLNDFSKHFAFLFLLQIPSFISPNWPLLPVPQHSLSNNIPNHSPLHYCQFSKRTTYSKILDWFSPQISALRRRSEGGTAGRPPIIREKRVWGWNTGLTPVRWWSCFQVKTSGPMMDAHFRGHTLQLKRTHTGLHECPCLG